jgi:hypothetical protein
MMQSLLTSFEPVAAALLSVKTWPLFGVKKPSSATGTQVGGPVTPPYGFSSVTLWQHVSERILLGSLLWALVHQSQAQHYAPHYHVQLPGEKLHPGVRPMGHNLAVDENHENVKGHHCTSPNVVDVMQV